MASDKNILIIGMLCVYFLVGCIFLAIYIGTKTSQNRKLKACTMSVDGYLLRSSHRDYAAHKYGINRDFNYYPVIQYFVNGVEYVKSWNYGRTKQWTPGPVIVKYNPDNPNDYYLEGFDLPKTFRRAMLAASFGCFAVGLLMLVLFLVL